MRAVRRAIAEQRDGPYSAIVKHGHPTAQTTCCSPIVGYSKTIPAPAAPLLTYAVTFKFR